MLLKSIDAVVPLVLVLSKNFKDIKLETFYFGEKVKWFARK